MPCGHIACVRSEKIVPAQSFLRSLAYEKIFFGDSGVCFWGSGDGP